MAKALNHYEILQVSKEASIEDIKLAFRRLARQYHPDVNPNNPAAAEKFKEISQAYETLSDENKRRRYDRNLKFEQQNQATKKVLNAQDFYFKGIKKTLEKDYSGAIENYTQAIRFNPRYVDAYLKRCEARYKLRDDKGVLEDCYQVLKINHKTPKAHYYQGRSRYRLGYIQSAIEAYSEAIRYDKNYVQAYYFRGLSYQELSKDSLAVQDLQIAAKLFREQKNFSAYRVTIKALKKLNNNSLKIPTFYLDLNNLLALAWRSFQIFAINPVGGILPAFAKLESQQALAIGILYGAIANVCFICGVYTGWSDLEFPLYKLFIIGAVPYLTLVSFNAIFRSIYRSSSKIHSDFFIAGATMLPIGFVALVLGIFSDIFSVIGIILAVFVFCYLVLILYSGCTQISNFSETAATFLVPLMLICSGFLSYLMFDAILLSGAI